MNRTPRHALLLGLIASVIASPVLAQKKEASEKAPAAAFATVNGKAIPKIRADALIAAQTAQGQPDTPELRKAITEELVRREILSQEATRKGIDKKPEVQGQMELARQSVLIGAYLTDYTKTHPVSEEAVKKEYETVKSKVGDKEYKARHILVEKEDEAKAIVDKLKKGEKFDELAKQSKDPGSKDRGGDLGWATPASFVKPFSEAMTKLAAGKYTETPVKSDFGWHVIQLDETRELKLPSLDEARPQISQQLQQKAVQAHLEELRAKAKVN